VIPRAPKVPEEASVNHHDQVIPRAPKVSADGYKRRPIWTERRDFSLCLSCPGPRLSHCREPKRRQWSRERNTLIVPFVSRTEVKLFCVSLSAGNDQEWTSGYSRPVPSTMSVKKIQQKRAALSLYQARMLCQGSPVMTGVLKLMRYSRSSYFRGLPKHWYKRHDCYGS